MQAMAGNLRGLLGGREEQGPIERELIGDFLKRRDAESMESIVRRHGPMVLGVCRRLLGDAEGADEACFATFAALARQAQSIQPAELLACWLHKVAGLAARRAKSSAETVPFVAREVSGENVWRKLRYLLDSEVERLPDNLRAPVIHCELQGRTRKEAGRLLGWPERLVTAGLTEGRSRLAACLDRTGLEVTTSDLAVALAQNVAWGLSASEVRVIAAAALAPSTSVGRLVDSTLAALLPRLRLWLAVSMAGGLLAVTAGLAFLLLARPSVRDHVTPAVSAAPPAKQMRHRDVARLAVGTLRVATAGGDEVRLWDLESGDYRVLTGFTGSVSALRFVRDDAALLIADENGVRILDVHDGRELSRLAISPCKANVFAVSPDGARLAGGGRSGVISIWEISSGKKQLAFQGPSYLVLDLAFGPGGREIAVAGRDNTSRLFDVETGRELVPAFDHKAFQTCVAFSPSGEVFASGGHDGAVTLRETSTGHVLRLLDAPTAVGALGFSDDGKRLVCCHKDGAVRSWEVASGREGPQVSGLGWPAALSADGRQVGWVIGERLGVSPTDR